MKNKSAEGLGINEWSPTSERDRTLGAYDVDSSTGCPNHWPNLQRAALLLAHTARTSQTHPLQSYPE